MEILQTARRVKMMATWLLLLCSSFPENPAHGAGASITEDQVKALFLFNFAKYVDWPAEKSGVKNAPIIIGVLGQVDFQEDLKRAVEGKTISGRPILVRQVIDADLGTCHILFISGSEKSRLDQVLSKMGALPILTVGQQDDFLQKGGIINFTMKGENVRLEINLKAARQAKVQISSKLLSVADVVLGDSN